MTGYRRLLSTQNGKHPVDGDAGLLVPIFEFELLRDSRLELEPFKGEPEPAGVS